MNSRKVTAFFLLSLLLMGPGCYAEDTQGSNAPLPVMVSSADPTSVVTPFTSAQATGQWSEGWYQGAEGYDKAVEEYKKTNKPMLVYMSVVWCKYCRQFERGVLSSPKVRDFLKDKIKVSINPESGNRENELAFQYGIRGFPSLFLHPPQPGRPLRFPTSVTSEEFVELFQESIQ